MPFPSLAHSPAPVTESEADALVLLLPPLADDRDVPGFDGLARIASRVGFTGSAGAFVRVALDDVALPVVLVGVGASDSAAALRAAAGAAARQLTGFARVALAAPLHPDAAWRGLAEGAALGGYRFAGYKSEPPSARASEVIVHTAARPAAGDAEAVAAVAGGEIGRAHV